MSVRQLIVNADDYGVADSVNAAVEACLERGRISSASLLVNGPRAAEALAYTRANPHASVGLHFNLTHFAPIGSRSPLAPSGRFAGFGALARAQAASASAFRKACVDELGAQFDRFTDATGRRPSHLDTHLWIQLFPGVFDAMIEVACERGVPALRMVDCAAQPGALRRALAAALRHGGVGGVVYQWAKVVLMETGARLGRHRRALDGRRLFGPAIHAGVAEGLLYTDVPTRLAVLEDIVRALPADAPVELLVHPGGDGTVDGMHYDARHAAIERDALLSDEWPALLARHSARLWRGFGAAGEA